MHGDREKKRYKPERTEREHFVQCGVLAILYVTRSEVLNRRLIRANEHEMR